MFSAFKLLGLFLVLAHCAPPAPDPENFGVQPLGDNAVSKNTSAQSTISTPVSCELSRVDDVDPAVGDEIAVNIKVSGPAKEISFQDRLYANTVSNFVARIGKAEEILEAKVIGLQGQEGTCQLPVTASDPGDIGCTLTADKATLAPGGSLTIQFGTRGQVDFKYFRGVPIPLDRKSVTVEELGTFEAKVSGPSGTAVCSLEVVAEASKQEELSCKVSATPTKVAQGQEIILNLEAVGSVERVMINGTAVPIGSKAYRLTPEKSMTYQIEVSNAKSKANCSAAVEVIENPMPPGCTLVADKSDVKPGDKVLLTIARRGDISAAFFETEPVADLDKPTKEVIVNLTTTYRATVRGPAGESTCETTVTVMPQTLSCALVPDPAEVVYGSDVNLNVVVTGKATSAMIDGTQINEAPFTKKIKPSADRSYEAVVQGENGLSAKCAALVKVKFVAPTCELTAVPDIINVGGKSVLAVVVPANTPAARAVINGAALVVDAATGKFSPLAVAPGNTTNYSATVYGPDNQTGTCTKQVQVLTEVATCQARLVTNPLYRGDKFDVEVSTNATGARLVQGSSELALSNGVAIFKGVASTATKTPYLFSVLSGDKALATCSVDIAPLPLPKCNLSSTGSEVMVGTRFIANLIASDEEYKNAKIGVKSESLIVGTSMTIESVAGSFTLYGEFEDRNGRKATCEAPIKVVQATNPDAYISYEISTLTGAGVSNGALTAEFDPNSSLYIPLYVYGRKTNGEKTLLQNSATNWRVQDTTPDSDGPDAIVSSNGALQITSAGTATFLVDLIQATSVGQMTMQTLSLPTSVSKVGVLQVTVSKPDKFLRTSTVYPEVFASIRMQNGSSFVTSDVFWSTSDSTIATFVGSELRTHGKAGQVKLIATYGKESHALAMDVLSAGQIIETIEATPSTVTLYFDCSNDMNEYLPDLTSPVTVKATYADGSQKNLVNFTLVSSHDSVTASAGVSAVYFGGAYRGPVQSTVTVIEQEKIGVITVIKACR